MGTGDGPVIDPQAALIEVLRCRRRGRPHREGDRDAGRHVVDVDAQVQLSRRPHRYAATRDAAMAAFAKSWRRN